MPQLVMIKRCKTTHIWVG